MSGDGYVRQSSASIQPLEEITAAPLNNEFNQIQSAFNSSTGHAHDGSTGNGPQIDLTTSVTGIRPIANGGTGTSGSVVQANTYTANTTFALERNVANSYMEITGDTAANTGANIRLFGSGHASADYIQFREDSSVLLQYDGTDWSSSVDWTFTGSVDINGGNIDGTVIGASTPANGTFENIAGTRVTLEGTFPIYMARHTSAPADYATGSFAVDSSGNFAIQTRDSDLNFVSNDYLISRNASGATDHSWRIGGTETMSLDTSGLTVAGTLTVSEASQAVIELNDQAGVLGGDIDTQIQFKANGTIAAYIGHSGTAVGNFFINNEVAGGNIQHEVVADRLHRFFVDDTERFRVDGTGVLLGDGDVLRLGGGDDLQIYHGTTNNYIDNETASLLIRQRVNSEFGYLQANDSSGVTATCLRWGGAAPNIRLLYDNDLVTETFQYGLSVTHATSPRVRIIDETGTATSVNSEIEFYYDGSEAGRIGYDGNDDLDIYNGLAAGHIYYNMANTSGVHVFQIDGLERVRIDSDGLRLGDDYELRIGGGNDTRLWHNGSDTYLDNYTGSLYIRSREHSSTSGIIFQDEDGSGVNHTTATFEHDGVSLRYDNLTRLLTTSAGGTLTGNWTVTDTMYVGSNGSGDSPVFFYDDSNNQYRDIRWDDSEGEFRFEDDSGAYHTLLGVGQDQTWQVVTGSRAMNTVYQNTTNRPILVMITVHGSGSTAINERLTVEISTDNVTYVDVGQTSNASHYGSSISVVVPSGHFYRAKNKAFTIWSELRE